MPTASNFYTNRADLSQFLIHLTKDGAYENWVQVTANGLVGYDASGYTTVAARPSLIDIINTKKIEARSPFGYFKLRINRYRPSYQRVFVNGGADPAWIKSVCFSETPLKELRNFYQTTVHKRNAYKKYGLAFWQDNVRNVGGNPIFYVDSRKTTYLQSLNQSQQSHFIPLMHLCETFGPPVLLTGGYSDFRWEREWRKLDSYNFDWHDVAFGICPDEEIPFFEGLASNRVVFLDPDWDEPTLRQYLSGKAPHLLAHL
ncbi:MAG TPA: hypothetical protein VF412_05165 [Bdellovibrio sp.]|uniref:hypothetical protein n=1 Tax=Bdellovibrio sp. TaxID=28201 RepID=UPI002EFB69A5